MSITFKCERCRKDVKADDSAAGKRGKCPFCGHSTYVPTPVNDDEILPLAPLNEDEERQRQEQVKALLAAEHDLLSESGSPISDVPLEHREGLSTQDLHHFVVNYCLDVAGGKLERAETYVPKLRQFGAVAGQAVDDFLERKVLEPALDPIPGRVLQGLLMQLKDKVKA